MKNTEETLCYNVNKRISKIANYLNINMTEIADAIGVSRGTLYEINSGRHLLSRKMAGRICSIYPQFSREWLITGDGDMILGNKVSEKRNTEPKNIVLVPIINLDARGGLLPNDVNDTISYTVGVMPFSNEYAHEGDVVIPIYGDSMAPQYPSGSMVMIRRVDGWREYIDFGKTYVLELNDGRRVIKTVCKGDKPERYILKSINEKYEDSPIPVNFIRAVYRVVLTVRKEEV